MTFFEWLGMLTATGILTCLGFTAGFVAWAISGNRERRGLERVATGLWIGATVAAATLAACLVLIWGLNPLPSRGAHGHIGDGVPVERQEP